MSAELIAILAVGVTIGGLLFSNNRELRRDIADLRERMARLEGLFEGFIKGTGKKGSEVASGRRCGLERWRGNELNTELGARYSTRWLRSGCPIRTAPGDSATGTGRSAICSGPCNNAPICRKRVPRKWGLETKTENEARSAF